MATVAAVTIVYNENRKLPRWVEYYSRQLGARNCFVLDHGSDDGSTDNLSDVQLIRLPRTPYDNQLRVDAISSLAGFLLKFYSHVIYADCDEFVVADPGLYSGIGDFCNNVNPEYLYSIGIDVLHKFDEEPPLRPADPVLRQRSYGHFSAAMCKTNLIRHPVNWAPGFHSHNHRPVFGPLINFHLRYADLDEGLERLEVTRSLAWAKSYEGTHQKAPNSEFEGHMRHWGRLPVIADDPWRHDSGILGNYLSDFAASAYKPESAQTWTVDITTFGNELLTIPARFKGML